MPKYSQVERKALHDELKQCSAVHAVEFLKDYKVLRDQARIN